MKVEEIENSVGKKMEELRKKKIEELKRIIAELEEAIEIEIESVDLKKKEENWEKICEKIERCEKLKRE